MSETQQKILRAAEVEFADNGLSGASIRNITSRAGVNVAAVNYHFGSKNELFKQMVRHRMAPVNAKRLEMLGQAQARYKARPIPVKRIVEMYVRPAVMETFSQEDSDFYFMRAVAKGIDEEPAFLKELYDELLRPVLEPFSQALAQSSRQPSDERVWYSMHLMICTMIGAMKQHKRLSFISKGKLDLLDAEGFCNYLVAFIAGGIKACSKL